MTLLKNKYRIESARAQNWDYGSNARYFVTICTKSREHYFGKIVDEEMHLSGIGNIASQCWDDIPKHFPFVELDVYVVMPNHVHGIIIINKNSEDNNTVSQELSAKGNHFGTQSQNLGSIIRGVKIGVTKYALANSVDFGWQSRFHDHIIRDEESFLKIRNYIITNPQRWDKDKFNYTEKIDSSS